MLVITPHCDVCKTQLNVKSKQTPLGEIQYVQRYKTKVWNTESIFPDLCQKCALLIDNNLLCAKLNILEKSKRC